MGFKSIIIFNYTFFYKICVIFLINISIEFIIIEDSLLFFIIFYKLNFLKNNLPKSNLNMSIRFFLS